MRKKSIELAAGCWEEGKVARGSSASTLACAAEEQGGWVSETMRTDEQMGTKDSQYRGHCQSGTTVCQRTAACVNTHDCYGSPAHTPQLDMMMMLHDAYKAAHTRRDIPKHTLPPTQ